MVKLDGKDSQKLSKGEDLYQCPGSPRTHKWINNLLPVLGSYNYHYAEITHLIKSCDYNADKIQEEVERIMQMNIGHEQGEWKVVGSKSKKDTNEKKFNNVKGKFKDDNWKKNNNKVTHSNDEKNESKDTVGTGGSGSGTGTGSVVMSSMEKNESKDTVGTGGSGSGSVVMSSMEKSESKDVGGVSSVVLNSSEKNFPPMSNNFPHTMTNTSTNTNNYPISNNFPSTTNNFPPKNFPTSGTNFSSNNNLHPTNPSFPPTNNNFPPTSNNFPPSSNTTFPPSSNMRGGSSWVSLLKTSSSEQNLKQKSSVIEKKPAVILPKSYNFESNNMTFGYLEDDNTWSSNNNVGTSTTTSTWKDGLIDNHQNIAQWNQQTNRKVDFTKNLRTNNKVLPRPTRTDINTQENNITTQWQGNIYKPTIYSYSEQDKTKSFPITDTNLKYNKEYINGNNTNNNYFNYTQERLQQPPGLTSYYNQPHFYPFNTNKNINNNTSMWQH